MSIDLLALFVRDGGSVFPTGWPYFSDGVALKLRDDGLLRPIFVSTTAAFYAMRYYNKWLTFHGPSLYKEHEIRILQLFGLAA